MTTAKLSLPDTREIAAALAAVISASMPPGWWDEVGKEVVASIDLKALRRDIAAEVAARMQPSEVYKGGDFG